MSKPSCTMILRDPLTPIPPCRVTPTLLEIALFSALDTSIPVSSYPSWSTREHTYPMSYPNRPAHFRLQLLELRLRRHAEHESLTQAPHPIRHPSRHRRRLKTPLLGRRFKNLRFL